MNREDSSMENQEWLETRCEVCGSAEQALVFEGPDLLHHLPGRFSVVRCLYCGTFRQNPCLTWNSLKYYYPEEYVSYGEIISHDHSPLRRWGRRYGMWKRLNAIQKFQPGGKLLDVGCGTGIFLGEAQRTGRWDLVGVEPNPRAAEYARRHLHLHVVDGKFSEVSFPDGTFDVITFWNVLEHLYQPIQDLQYARRLLKDQGWLVFSIPNLESWGAETFGPYWLGWDLPRHLYLFPGPRLHSLLDEIGFQIVSTRCLAGSYQAHKHNLEFWLQSLPANHRRFGLLAYKIYCSPFGRLASFIPLWVMDRLRRSCIITIFAKKNPSLSSPLDSH